MRGLRPCSKMVEGNRDVWIDFVEVFESYFICIFFRTQNCCSVELIEYVIHDATKAVTTAQSTWRGRAWRLRRVRLQDHRDVTTFASMLIFKRNIVIVSITNELTSSP